MGFRSPAWADQLDFVGPRVRTASWSWVCLLAGVVAVVWVIPEVNEAQAELAQAQSDLQRLRRATHQAEVVRKAVTMTQSATPADAAPALTGDAARQAAQLAQWLAYPWLKQLARVEEAAQAEHTVMLSFSLDLSPLASRPDAWPELRLSAAVRDDVAALRWAQTLSPQAQLLGRERLSAPITVGASSFEWRVEATIGGVTP